MDKDVLTLCREWQSYWATHNEVGLRDFAEKAGDEIERLREYGTKMRQVCTQLSEEIHRLDPTRPVPEVS